MKFGGGNARGFTLVEVLVALGIFALLITTVYAALNSVLRSTREVEDISAVDQAARISLDMMVRELRSTMWERGKEGEVGTSYEFSAEDHEFEGHPLDALRFTALSHSRSEEASLAILEYVVVADPRTEKGVLIRREETNMLSSSIGTVEQFEIAEGVTGLNFRFFDGEAWVDGWSAADRNKLPKAVQIRISLADSTGRDWTFSTQTDIPLGQTS